MAIVSTSPVAPAQTAQILSYHGKSFVSGLQWHPLGSLTGYMKEAREYGRLHKMDIVAIRRTPNVIQAGFVARSAGAMKGMYSLAAALAGQLGQSWLAAWQVPGDEPRYALVAVIDGAVIPGYDLVGSATEIQRKVAQLESRALTFDETYLPIEFGLGGKPLDIDELLQPSNLKRDYALNDINNAATINATGNVNLNGTVNAGGDVHAGSLYLNGNATLNGTVNAGGDVRAGSLYLQGNATMNGTATVEGNVAVSGDTTTGSMYARGNVQGVTASMSGETYTTGWFRTRGDTGWYSEKWGGGWHMTDSDWVRAYAGKSVYTSGQMRGNSLFSDGRTYVGEYIQLIGSATENAGCATNGLVSRDGGGALLSCQSGLWKRQVSKTPTCHAYTIPGYDPNDVTTYACPVGTKVGWDTGGSGQRWASTPNIAIGQNDYATIFCCEF
ncbi:MULTISPECIES: type 4b pilus protein PilO2 [unclassified Pseudomonas]|uniref:type 4b pilus protein PilO2 n=1 Tax=unclassified Pseudomonas TaxID=196821 RepID=UPI002115B86D|nr:MULTISPECIES: type 4b pilus protein PilO2 [unclassified Pseudomonas]